MSNSLRPHELKHTRLLCPSLFSGVCSNSCPLSWWYYLILCHPFPFLPAIFPSIKVFSSESALHIRWSKYWSFSFSIRPSNEYSRLLFFRTDFLQRSFDLLAVQGTLKSLLQNHKAKESILQCSAFFIMIKESIYNDKRVNSPGKY